MWKAYCLKEVAEKEVRTQTGPHALRWHAERDDVAESPMEILTQTFNVWKRACVCVHVCISLPLSLKK